MHFFSREIFRSSNNRCSVTKGVLRNFAKFTGKHLCQSPFQRPKACNFIIKENLVQSFSGEFCAISKDNLFTEHLRETVSEKPFRLTLCCNYNLKLNFQNAIFSI